MTQIIFVFGLLTISCNVKHDFCQMFKEGIPIWAGDHNELIELLKSVHHEPTI